MKSALVLLLAFAPLAAADPVYRCEDSLGAIAFQGRPCKDQPSQAAGQLASARRASFVTTPSDEHSDWINPELSPQRQQVTPEAHAETLRVLGLQKPWADRQAAKYAGNQRRCLNAMQIAALCGKFAGMFSCDGKGFRANAIAGGGNSRTTGSMIDNGSTLSMEQCALQAAGGD